ncbi:unnamed protein product [Peniophora sp. CBMAI 1063]|nr:unnamed protein product [Peniophora sp. CBMAI 1063]
MNCELHIGRGAHNDLVLPDPHISWAHCLLTYAEHQYESISLKVTAKKTTNGTFINGIRLKAGQTRALVSGDTISFGVFKAPLPKTRLREWLGPDDTLEGNGLPSERRRLQNARWQFKLHLFGSDHGPRPSDVSRVVREAWKDIFNCRRSMGTSRSVLSRLKGVDYPPSTAGSAVEGDVSPRRPTTPLFRPPPDKFASTGRGSRVDYQGGDGYFGLVKDPSAPSWYHPDIIWLGEVRHKPDPLGYELPFPFKYWSSVYGLPQGLHPLWAEFSSAVYGDDCPDVGRESVLLLGVPPMPEWLSAQIPEYAERREGAERATFDSMARRVEIERLYTERREQQTDSHTLSLAESSTAVTPASSSPKKRKPTVDRSPHLPCPSTSHDDNARPHDLEPPRKRKKRDALTNLGTASDHTINLRRARLSASVSTPTQGSSTPVDESRPRKGTRPQDEEPALRGAPMRVAGAINVAAVTTDRAVSRPVKRRRLEPDSERSAPQPPAKRASRSGKRTPEATGKVQPRASEHQQAGVEGTRPASKRKRSDPSDGSTPAAIDDAPHPAKRHRTMPPSEEAGGPDVGKARRSTRLKGKTAPRYR